MKETCFTQSTTVQQITSDILRVNDNDDDNAYDDDDDDEE